MYMYRIAPNLLYIHTMYISHRWEGRHDTVQIRDENVAIDVPWDSTVALDCSAWRENTHTLLHTVLIAYIATFLYQSCVITC